MKPGGFTSKDLAVEMASRYIPGYSCRNASYHIKKFRGKAMVLKIPGKIRYEVTEKGVKYMAAILCMMNPQLPTLFSTITSPWTEQQKEHLLLMDEYLFDVRNKCEQIRTLQHMKLSA